MAPKSGTVSTNIDEESVVNTNEFKRVLLAKKFVCHCQQGFTGPTCEIDVKCPNGKFQAQIFALKSEILTENSTFIINFANIYFF